MACVKSSLQRSSNIPLVEELATSVLLYTPSGLERLPDSGLLSIRSALVEERFRSAL
jgi:hypothetical protein